MTNRVLLYVEDEDAAAFLFETALKEAAISVELYRVSDGEEALSFLRGQGSYAKASTPDLIVLDLNLPRKNGLEVLAELKKNGKLSTIPVVVFTSSSLSSDKQKSWALGARRVHYQAPHLRWICRGCESRVLLYAGVNTHGELGSVHVHAAHPAPAEIVPHIPLPQAAGSDSFALPVWAAKVEYCAVRCLCPHEGHSTASASTLRRTNFSNFVPQSSQEYSKIGMLPN